MPIYEYRCGACGVAKEHLQKLSDEPIAQCPACGSAEYRKQLSAAASS
ncbi:zinc ribbon domain-containing protein [Chromobacterium haemolyticum]|nr:zinc ribbon domain-containing protein [Chromobacterium haemolyticum]